VLAAGLLEAAAGAPTTVVGTVHAPARIDLHGRVAELAVERTLRGDATPQARLRIAWEELASGSPDRFREGQRILVALEPLPDLSLWHARFPAGDALAVARRGAGFLRDPDAASVDLLAAYLVLPAGERAGEAGARALAALVSGAEPGLAGSALAGLGSLELPVPVTEELARALADETRPLDLRRGILGLAGERRLAALRPGVEALANGPGPLAPDALEALARLDGSLPPARVRELLASPDAALRRVGVRQAGATLGVPELAGLLRSDPDPGVRAAGVAVLAARSGDDALEAASSGLFDPDPGVRREAVAKLGARGAEAVPLCVRLAFERRAPDAAGPLAVLAIAGPAGRDALVEIATRHEDPKVRDLARLALGRPLPEH
jgi:hypothetical protein